MNRYFANTIKHMNLKTKKISHREEQVNILNTFKYYKNVQMIKLANFHSYSTLNSSKVTESQVRKEILNISLKKVTKNGDISAKVLKKSVNIYIKEIRFVINNCTENGIFSDDLKLANVSPVFKQGGNQKKIVDRLAYYHTYQKLLKESFINKLILS